MNDLKTYLLRVTLAAIACSILLRITGNKSSSGKVVRLLSGLFITVTVLSPVVTLDWHHITLYPASLSHSAESVVSAGSEMAEQELDAIIISKTETYILDKAASMGAILQVEVILRDHIPKSVRIWGAISPGAKSRLSAWIQDNLNIEPEELQWN